MIRFALVGCGRISRRHAELLATGAIEGARLVAVCDIVSERASELGEKLSIPWYTDMHKMMHSEIIDVVSVLTESGLHARHVVSLAHYGKHIVVEKPMALTLPDADAMIRACDRCEAKSFQCSCYKIT